MRLIDADALKMEFPKDEDWDYPVNTNGFVCYLIDAQPTIEPERKKGKWMCTDDGWDGEYFVCSECGCPWTLIDGSPEDNGMNYCPNCGADMRPIEFRI